MIATLANAPDDLQILKVYLLDFTGLDRDALHLHAGLALFILVRLGWRWRGGWMIAWLAALMVALGVEWMDIRADGSLGAPQPQPEHWQYDDMANGAAAGRAVASAQAKRRTGQFRRFRGSIHQRDRRTSGDRLTRRVPAQSCVRGAASCPGHCPHHSIIRQYCAPIR
jgi:hypothetical protein